MKLITPPYLQKGDEIALVAPAGFIEDDKAIVTAEKLLQSWGLKTSRGSFVLEKNGSFAGTDKERLQDVQKTLDNPKIKAIWAVRGGYGSMRILPKLNFDKFIKHPKWFVGFSDITAFHNTIHKLGYKSIHGMMPINLLSDSENTKKAVESIHDALFGNSIEYIIPSSSYNKYGSTTGVIVGGNLALLQSLLGSSYQLKTANKILFIEEVGEELYRIDRLLRSLKEAGVFKGLLGLAVGSFSHIKQDEHWKNKTYQEIILEVVNDYNFPVIFDVPSGHTVANNALILGEVATINVGEFVSCIQFLKK